MPDAPDGNRPRPRKRPQQERSRLTVEAIIEATSQVLERDGYDALTTSRVAERAGVSVGTLYQYYPDKAAVVAGLVEARLGDEARAIRAAFDDARRLPLPQAADRLVDAFVGLFAGDPAGSAAVLYGALRVQWRPVIDDLATDMVDAVAGLLARQPGAPARDPQQTTYVAVAAVISVVARSLVERPEAVRDGTVAREVRRLVRPYVVGA